MIDTGGVGRRLAGGTLAVLLVLVATSCFKPFDFDNDDKADLMLVDGTTAVWSRYGDPTPVWTGPGGFPVPGDYDGDGSYEPAEAGSGPFFTAGPAGTIDWATPCNTSSGSQVMRVARNYVGDAKTEPAYYCENTGTFMIKGQAPVVFGSTGTGHDDPDFPVPADYDGDGKADLATYNPRSGDWHLRSSNSGTDQIVHFQAPVGISLPTPGDFDGDHRADLAYYSYADRSIHVRNGATIPLPAATAPTTVLPIPAIADYDGDGLDDASVFDLYLQFPNPTAGHWQIVDSSTGTPRTLTVAPSTEQNYRIPANGNLDVVTKISAWTLIEQCRVNPSGWGC